MNSVLGKPALVIVAAVAVLALGVCAPSAAAAKSPPQGVPAIAEYVETFPTARGPVAAPGGQTAQTPYPVRPSLTKRIRAQGGKDAALLGSLAESAGRRIPGRAAPISAPRQEGIPSAVASRGGTPFLLLVIGLLATGAGAVGFGLTRRLRSGRR
jgi:hypothetical protein